MTHSMESGESQNVVLLVDDEEELRRALARALRLEGFRVLTAASGAEGLRIVRSGQARIVLCDLGLRDMHGFDFLESACGLNVEVFLMSGGVEEDWLTDERAKAAAGCFQKPFADVGVILSSLRQVCSGPDAN